MASVLIARIQRNLSDTRATLWMSVSRLLQRGESAERLEVLGAAIVENSKLFDVETERHVATPWQRRCGRGRWLQWLCPCIPIWRWVRGQISLHWGVEGNGG